MKRLFKKLAKQGYCINPRYKTRSKYKGKPTLNQKIMNSEVYALADYFGELFGCQYLIYIGCENDSKLSRLHAKYQIIGLDSKRNLLYYRSKYPDGIWLDYNLDSSKAFPISESMMKRSVMICSHVIERLDTPAYVLDTIRRMMKWAPVCLLATTERQLVGGGNKQGPPLEPSHVREWNRKEFKRLLHVYDFNVEFIGLMSADKNELAKKSVLAILGKQKLSKTITKKLKVAAIMTTYNEEDIVFHAVKRLLDQKIHVYVIENWSTDSTYEILMQFNQHPFFMGCERFPQEGPDPYYNWGKLLKRVEDVARTIDADWFIFHDTDVIITSPWPTINLKQAIAYVDAMGFNAIDHTVINFYPVDNNFSGGDHESYFKYFQFGTMGGDFSQVKTWKHTAGRLALVQGGHQVWFPGRRVCPFKFLIKHYPLRSQSHAEKKIFHDRKKRWNPVEKKKGWHVHYDHLQEGQSFLQNAEQLEFFDERTFMTNYLAERISGIGIKSQLNPNNKKY